MATVAEQLRSAREALSMDVYQAAEITKIKSDHIRALESGDYDIFSAPVYVRGFVRTYAKALKLDPARIMEALELEIGEEGNMIDKPATPANAEEAPGILDLAMLQLSRLNWRIVLATVAAALVIFLTASALRNRALRNADPLRDLGLGIYLPPTNQTGERLAPPGSP